MARLGTPAHGPPLPRRVPRSRLRGHGPGGSPGTAPRILHGRRTGPHTNVPGLAHEKRWQDILALLDAGIHVLSTMNVQHVESLNDAVCQITGRARARETVPDWVLDQAEEVVLVDVSTRALLNRLRRGVVYPADKARQALGELLSRGKPGQPEGALLPPGRGHGRVRPAPGKGCGQRSGRGSHGVHRSPPGGSPRSSAGASAWQTGWTPRCWGCPRGTERGLEGPGRRAEAAPAPAPPPGPGAHASTCGPRSSTADKWTRQLVSFCPQNTASRRSSWAAACTRDGGSTCRETSLRGSFRGAPDLDDPRGGRSVNPPGVTRRHPTELRWPDSVRCHRNPPEASR